MLLVLITSLSLIYETILGKSYVTNNLIPTPWAQNVYVRSKDSQSNRIFTNIIYFTASTFYMIEYGETRRTDEQRILRGMLKYYHYDNGNNFYWREILNIFLVGIYCPSNQVLILFQT